MINYEIIENVLDSETFCDLKAWIESNTFHWYHYDEVTYRGDSFKKNEREALNLPADWPIENLTKEESDYNFMLGHKIYVDNVILTNETTWNKVRPILNILKMKSLIRCNVNYYPKTHTRLNHSYHTDFPFKHKGAIFYINDNDGLTILEDGTEVKSVANSLLLFDASRPHHSTTCTNTTRRLNININYF
jgi:hypothetical protein